MFQDSLLGKYLTFLNVIYLIECKTILGQQINSSDHFGVVGWNVQLDRTTASDPINFKELPQLCFTLYLIDKEIIILDSVKIDAQKNMFSVRSKGFWISVRQRVRIN